MAKSDASGGVESKNYLKRHSTPGRKKRDLKAELSDTEIIRAEFNIDVQPHSKLTGEVVGKLKQAFAIDATVEEACFYAGINKTTYYDWQKKYPKLANELEQLRHTPVLTARQTVINAIKTNPEMALKYLERKRKREFGTRTELTGADGQALPKPILNFIVNQNGSDDTKNDIIDGEVVPEPKQVKEGSVLDDLHA